ncbi:hypothetical protein Pcinc_004372 [Petrolisthes cinctipes]|uniref:Uncharacterized protein n=1 Tax=Petrolisthes cinctipes TaxID=88211 RepID=A0AAE1GH62_PETCI|nr:hypothetical protein Pcinc_004372 [Petrolisthes cinctipes]
MVEVRGEGGAPTSAHNQSAVSAAPPPRLAGRRTCTPGPDTHTDTVPIPLVLRSGTGDIQLDTHSHWRQCPPLSLTLEHEHLTLTCEGENKEKPTEVTEMVNDNHVRRSYFRPGHVQYALSPSPHPPFFFPPTNSPSLCLCGIV